MRILITGRGTSGSWQIRGVQLGRAIGAAVEANAMKVDGYDAVIVVKRADPVTVQTIHKAGIPLIHDFVDAWPQPHGNNWTREECMAWAHSQVEQLKPSAIVAATRAMASDFGEFDMPVLALPHHARPGQRRATIRAAVATVGYEGSVRHLGRWQAMLEAECERRRWQFYVNPPELAELDIVVALREATGYAPRHWKSGVKSANAKGAGVPIICNREAGYLETASGAEEWADTPDELAAALGALASQEVRRARADRLYAAAPTLERIAAEYQLWLRTLPWMTAARS
jgi:hypothetical protein